MPLWDFAVVKPSHPGTWLQAQRKASQIQAITNQVCLKKPHDLMLTVFFFLYFPPSLQEWRHSAIAYFSLNTVYLFYFLYKTLFLPKPFWVSPFEGLSPLVEIVGFRVLVLLRENLYIDYLLWLPRNVSFFLHCCKGFPLNWMVIFLNFNAAWVHELHTKIVRLSFYDCYDIVPIVQTVLEVRIWLYHELPNNCSLIYAYFYLKIFPSSQHKCRYLLVYSL